jgi:hypothetical protein
MPLGWYGVRKDRRRLLVQGAVGPLGVVILPPCCDDLTGLSKMKEPVDVEAYWALVAKRAVEARQVPILSGFARLNEISGYLLRVGPGVEHLARTLGPMIEGALLGSAMPFDQLVKHPDHALPGQGRIDRNRHARAGHEIQAIERDPSY